METNTIGVCNKYNEYDEYDEYDIIDFMEIDYLQYLDSLPKNVWSKFKKDVEKQLLNVKNIQVISLVLTKVNFDYYHYIIRNFNKINLNLLQYMVNADNEKIIKKIVSNNQIKFIFESSIQFHDLEFNKYIYENLCVKIKENNSLTDNSDYKNIFYKAVNLINIFAKNNKENTQIITETNKNNLSKTNQTNIEFKNLFEHMMKRFYIPKYLDVFEYYIKKLNLTISVKNYSFDSLVDLCNDMYESYSTDSYDKLIKLKNLFQMNECDFLSNVIFKKKSPYCSDAIIYKICKSGNIDYLTKVINNFNFEKKYFTDNIVANMFYNASLSKNINFIIILYNYLKINMRVNFNAHLLDMICYKIIHGTGSNHNQYDDIIYEFINLGAKIKGYSEYTEYIKSIKFLTNGQQKHK